MTSTQAEDMTGSQIYSNTQLIGASTEPIVFGTDLVAEGVGLIALKNTSATIGNWIDVATATPATTHVFVRLYPGQSCNIPSPTKSTAATDPTWYAIAYAANTPLSVGAVGSIDYTV